MISKIYTFVKKNNILNLNITYIYDIDEEYIQYEMAISQENLKKYKNLYQIYKISILLTKDIKSLHKNGILHRIIWKGIEITDYYTIDETNININTLNFEETNEETIEYMNETSGISSNFPSLISQEINKIEKELSELEEYYESLKRMKIDLTKIIPEKFPNILPDILIDTILFS